MKNDPESTNDSEASLNPESAVLLRVMSGQPASSSHYETGPLVNRGGMGAILEARQTSIQRTVAMKVILGPASEGAMARFVQEARITGQLEHPNIVPVHEIGVDEQQRLFYTMKFVKGITLHEALAGVRKRDPEALRRFTLAELLNIFQKICDAVAFAHSKGVIHRDLKPANVMIGDFGEALVVDWGLAKKLADITPESAGDPSPPSPVRPLETLRGSVLGTPGFMSPEQARGDGERVDERSDIYALGAILHTLLYLSPPVVGKDATEALGNVQTPRSDSDTGDLPHLSGGRLPESLQAVARKATGLKPENRYRTVADLQADVAAYQRGFATRAENATLWKQITLAVRRHRREAALSAFALAAVAGLAAYSFFKLSGERNRAAAALDELRGAAPAFVAQARAYALAEKFTDALERLDYALKLRPAEPEYLLAKGNLLQACLDFEAAARAYRAVEGPLRAGAQANAELSDSLAREKKEKGAVSKASLAQLFEAMLKEQRTASELMPMARLLGREREVALQYWMERLRELPFSLDPPIEKRLTARPDGVLKLDLSGTAVSDLRALTGIPVGELELARCVGVTDLTPLQNAALQRLDISYTSVSDLAPLAGSQLRSLVLRGSAVKDLSPLRGSALRSLDASQTEIADFSALSGTKLESLVLDGAHVADLNFLIGLPIKTLRLDGASVGGGLSVLTNLPSLETLGLPQNWLELPAAEISSIRGLARCSTLTRISHRPAARSASFVESAGKFWSEWERDLEWIERLLRTGAKPKLEKLSDNSWRIDLHDGPTDEISALAGVPISHLDISTTLVKDLSPLAGAPILFLDLRNTPVENLEPLRGMPLRTLYLYKTRVTDFSPLSTLKQLELLDLSVTPFSDLSILNSPHLAELRIGSTLVTDLRPLVRFPLRKLHCDSINVPSLAPLAQVPTLLWVIPPKDVPDVALLRALPNLELISYDWHPGSIPTMPPEKFWNSPEVIAFSARQVQEKSLPQVPADHTH